MIINDTKKYIFIHIPKTAGSSITSLLKHQHPNLYNTHTTVLELQNELPLYNEYFTFTFVRNPWDRLYSLYNFLCQKKMNPGAGENWDQIFYIKKGFKWWLIDHEWIPPYDKGKNKIPHQRNPQTNSLINKTGVIDVDFIGKIENLKADLLQLNNNVNINIQAPTINKTKHVPYTEIYDEEMKMFVNEFHQTDIKEFKYVFGN